MWELVHQLTVAICPVEHVPHHLQDMQVNARKQQKLHLSLLLITKCRSSICKQPNNIHASSVENLNSCQQQQSRAAHICSNEPYSPLKIAKLGELCMKVGR